MLTITLTYLYLDFCKIEENLLKLMFINIMITTNKHSINLNYLK